MKSSNPYQSRRSFLGMASMGRGVLHHPGLFAEELTRTPTQTEGPFYPDKLPLDTDNDLIVINDAITPAVGEITHLTGRILDAKGNPIRNAVVEIWQCDPDGAYLHTGDAADSQHGTRTSRDSADSSPARPANTTSGPSSRSRTRAAPPHIHVKI